MMCSTKSSRLGNPENLINDSLKRVLQYEIPELQGLALSLIPLDVLRKNSTSCTIHPPINEGDATILLNADECELCFFQELASWFKDDFFSWVNSPDCEACGKPSKFKARYSVFWPVSSMNRASQYVIDVEDHECTGCRNVTKFPRHTDASILIETRKGRCSEWAQVFTLFCRAIGYRARLVVDVTDHVWTEVYSIALKRWMHVDSCEASVDQPLLYEKGWGKKLSYIVAVGIDDIQDVSWRYSADHKGLMARRDPQADKILVQNVIQKRNELHQRYPLQIRRRLMVGVILELLELMVEPTTNAEYCGRISGDKDWIQSRSEDGGHSAQDSRKTIKLSEFTSTPGPAAVKIMYSSALDKYQIETPTGSDSSNSSWQKLASKSENLFRKEEKDWKMAYLARKHSAKPGIIEWRFDADKFLISRIDVDSGGFVKEGCEIACDILSDDGRFSASYKNVGKCSSQLLVPCRVLTVRFTLKSPPGGPDLSWQFAQLFREKVSKNVVFSFGFTIDLIQG
uniref:Peptide-N(4)-(N-acetyl-beta-glucosaminyl)asparagine amidase n=2 Tax=Lygus hesperus TaxID=30085 RepID=A0A146MAV1_LYGHE